MKTNLYLIIFAFFIISCSSNKNSDDFIKKTTGRYFFNADEIIEVNFKEGTLFLTWRNQNIKPLKINDSTFYVRELNEKLIFNAQQNNIILAEKREHKGEKYIFNKLKNNEKTPSEYLKEGNFEAALKGYLTIKKQDSLNPIIRERSLNGLGYEYLRNKEFKTALHIFKINTQLYPKSSNTYDSTGDAYLKMKDTVEALNNYKKALAINPENRSAKRSLQKLTKLEE